MTRNLTQESDNPADHVFERALNSSINLARTLGGDGVVSGKQYLSAPKQYHTVQKFRDREVVGNTGSHTNLYMNPQDSALRMIPSMSTLRKMLAMRRAGDAYWASADNMPMWLLKSPTFSTPTKSNLFDPTIIDATGKMNIDWSDFDVLRKYGGKI